MRSMKDSGIEWIGEIPEDWEIKKVKFIANSLSKGNGITKEDVLEEGDIQCVRYGEIYSRYDRDFCVTYSRTNKSIIPSPKFIQKGDILFACTGELIEEIGKNVVYMGDSPCLAGGDIIVMRHSQNPQFLNYALNSSCSQIQKSSGKTKLKVVHISAGEIGSVIVSLPPLAEQQAIATYLDQKCANIDNIIEKTKPSIEEYKKLRQAVITKAVTKGVRGDRPMKDSGIEWVGEFPEEWENTNPKALFTQRKDKAKEGEKQLTASQQYGVVFQDEYMEMTGTRIVTVEKDFGILKHVEAGDFVISMRSFQGGLEYSTKTGSISSAYVMLIPNLEKVFPRYYKWLLKSTIYINALQSTSNMVRDGQAMRYSNFAQVRLISLPMEEQKEIADFLDNKTAEIDALITQKEQFIIELENYKKSMIYEYVTGKKEVPHS